MASIVAYLSGSRLLLSGGEDLPILLLLSDLQPSSKESSQNHPGHQDRSPSSGRGEVLHLDAHRTRPSGWVNARRHPSDEQVLDLPITTPSQFINDGREELHIAVLHLSKTRQYSLFLWVSLSLEVQRKNVYNHFGHLLLLHGVGILMRGQPSRL